MHSLRVKFIAHRTNWCQHDSFRFKDLPAPITLRYNERLALFGVGWSAENPAALISVCFPSDCAVAKGCGYFRVPLGETL